MKKRGVLLNAMSFSANRETYGVHRFEAEIVKELDKIDNLYCNIAVVTTKNSTIFDELKQIRVIKIYLTGSKPILFFWNLFGYPLFAYFMGYYRADLVLTNSLPGSDIIAIHDCIRENEYKKKAKKTLRGELFSFRVKKNIKKCKHIITVSEYSKKEILETYDIQENKISVVHNGWQHMNSIIEETTIIEKLGLGSRMFVFSLGSRSKRKNDKWIIAAAKQNPQYYFVISGSSCFMDSNDEVYADIPDNVIFTGYITDAEMKSLMRYCYVFLYPSLAEGFGIPPMEAMSVGAKCIVSNATALPEIYKKSVWYIDPNSYENIDIDKIMCSSISENRIVLDMYSWEKSAKQVADLLNTTLFQS